MKYLIISDLHLTKHYTERKKNNYLALFKSVDRIIINGDLWESYKISFDEFMASDWAVLFPVMKEKHTIYIEGNHDVMEECDDRVFRFCDAHLSRYELEYEGTKYHIEHGHLLTNDLPTSSSVKRFIKYHMSYFELPAVLFLNGLIQKAYSRADIRYLKQFSGGTKVRHIFGHTHIQEEDLKNNYINTGFCRFHYLQYAIIENGVLSLH